MATRFYFASNSSSKTPAASSGWYNSPGTLNRRKLLTSSQSPSNLSGAWPSATETAGSATLNSDVSSTYLYQYITQPLAAQTLAEASTFTFQSLAYETSGSANAIQAMIIRRFNSSDVLQGSEQLSNIIETELPGTTQADAVNRHVVSTITPAMSISNGDYFVIELGFYFDNTMTSSYTAYHYIQYNSGYSDLGANETDTSTSLNPWIECSQTLTFASASSIKTKEGLTYSSVKTIEGLAVASVKNIQGLARKWFIPRKSGILVPLHDIVVPRMVTPVRLLA